MKEGEPSPGQEPILENLMMQYLVSYASGETSASAKAVEKIRQWMQRSTTHQELVRNRLEEREEEYPENERRNVYLPVLQPSIDNEAISALQRALFPKSSS